MRSSLTLFAMDVYFPSLTGCVRYPRTLSKVKLRQFALVVLDRSLALSFGVHEAGNVKGCFESNSSSSEAQAKLELSLL